MSADPAMEKYLPETPTTDEAKSRNNRLLGEGGVFEPTNLALYSYARNSPVKLADPTGRIPVDPQIVFSSSNPIQQQTFDERYGFHGPGGATESCKAVALLNLYVAKTPGGISAGTLDKIVVAAKAAKAFNSDGSPHDLNALSKAAAQVLGRSKYFSLVYPEGGADTKKMSEVDFAYSKYEAGIDSLTNAKTGGPHFVLVQAQRGGTQDASLNTTDSVDPSRQAAKDYESDFVEPLKEIKLEQ